jgi:catechol 2,3-dioxygenase-like lactoylglutathione lyase family enzyme
MKTIALAAAAAAIIAAPAFAAPPAGLMPKAIEGPGWNVIDLDAQKAWYMDKLGMKALRSIDRNGKPFEWIMGYDGGGAILALLSSPNRPKGPNQMARLILDCPNAKALADNLKAQGVPVREVIPGAAYFITDPEGNPIELYTLPPAPR